MANAIRVRQGAYPDFDAAKLLAGELAAILSGDPAVTDGKALYICFAAGDVKRLATWEDMPQLIAAELPESYGWAATSGSVSVLDVSATSDEDSTSFTISHVAQTTNDVSGLDPYASGAGDNTLLGSTTLTDGASFYVPCVSYDVYGHVTGISYRKFTMSASGMASLTKPGKVIPDGTTIGIDNSGKIFVINCLHYVGTAQTASPSVGDFVVVGGVAQFWNGSAWIEISPDLSGYVTTANLTTALAAKADLASPALTGTPTAPTAATSTDTTQLATTAFVQQEINANKPGNASAANAGVVKVGSGLSIDADGVLSVSYASADSTSY